MATGTIILDIGGGVPDDTNPPQRLWTTAGRPYLAFDQTTSELILWSFRMPENYASGLTAKILWSASAASAPATSETLAMDVEVMAVTPETDTASMLADDWDTANGGTDDALGTNARRLETTLSITLTNADNVAAGDYVAVRLSRDVAADDLTEDAWIWGFSLEYTTS